MSDRVRELQNLQGLLEQCDVGQEEGGELRVSQAGFLRSWILWGLENEEAFNLTFSGSVPTASRDRRGEESLQAGVLQDWEDTH